MAIKQITLLNNLLYSIQIIEVNDISQGNLKFKSHCKVPPTHESKMPGIDKEPPVIYKVLVI